jgi:hypothetical protein
MGKDKPERVETPMLRAYLRDTKVVPSFAFDWPDWGGWIVFVGCLSIPHVGWLVGIVAGSAAAPVMRNLKRPQTEAQRIDEQRYKTVRRLKSMMNGGSMRSHVPSEILAALEMAAIARHTALVRMADDDPYDQVSKQAQLDDCMVTCIRAAGPTFRDDNQSGREWRSLQDNRQLMGAVTEAILAQIYRMENVLGVDRERLAALRELEAELGTLQTESL